LMDMQFVVVASRHQPHHPMTRPDREHAR
jgi:hypothetical protein